MQYVTNIAFGIVGLYAFFLGAGVPLFPPAWRGKKRFIILSIPFLLIGVSALVPSLPQDPAVMVAQMRQMAELPADIDENTQLKDISMKGSDVLFRLTTKDQDALEAKKEDRATQVREVCENGLYAAFLKNGAGVKMIYAVPGKADETEFSFMPEDCGY